MSEKGVDANYRFIAAYQEVNNAHHQLPSYNADPRWVHLPPDEN